MSEPVKQLSISLMDIKKPNGVLHYRLVVDGASIEDVAEIELVIEAMRKAMYEIRLDLNKITDNDSSIIEVELWLQ